MNASLNDYARRLEAGLGQNLRNRLATDPRLAIQGVGVRVLPLAVPALTDDCSCDGVFYPFPSPAIGYTATQSRRENFTLLHEFGHYLIRSDDELLSDLADMDDGAEERVCDSFAGRLLVPDDLIDGVLAGRRPEANDLLLLYKESIASREACAVRLAERIPCLGYVALLDHPRREVRFASPSSVTAYWWRRGTQLPATHPAWRAVSQTAYRGEGEVIWPGGRKNLWLDAVFDGSVVVAVFAEDRYWAAEGLSLKQTEAVTQARGIALSGTCRHCRANSWGYRACDLCGDPVCRSCGKCGCGAPPPLEQACTRCYMIKGSAQFARGSSVCRDCGG